jgi:hypothetical protein
MGVPAMSGRRCEHMAVSATWASFSQCVIHVILDDPCQPWAPIRKHRVGREVHMDLTEGQAVLHV